MISIIIHTNTFNFIIIYISMIIIKFMMIQSKKDVSYIINTCLILK